MGRLAAMEDFMKAMRDALIDLAVEVGRRQGDTFRCV